MLDEHSLNLQKKATFTFITCKDINLTVEKLLVNPLVRQKASHE